MPNRGTQFVSLEVLINSHLVLVIACTLLLFLGISNAHSHDKHQTAAQASITPADSVLSVLVDTASKAHLDHKYLVLGLAVEKSTPITAFLMQAADLHSAIIHFPIAWVVLLVLLEGWSSFRRLPLSDAGLPLAILAALSFLPAAITGLLHAQEMASAVPALLKVVHFHRSLAVAGGGLMGLAAGLRLGLRRHPSTGLRIAYWIALIAVMALSLSAGHQGGIIAHSEM